MYVNTPSIEPFLRVVLRKAFEAVSRFMQREGYEKPADTALIEAFLKAAARKEGFEVSLEHARDSSGRILRVVVPTASEDNPGIGRFNSLVINSGGLNEAGNSRFRFENRAEMQQDPPPIVPNLNLVLEINNPNAVYEVKRSIKSRVDIHPDTPDSLLIAHPEHLIV